MRLEVPKREHRGRRCADKVECVNACRAVFAEVEIVGGYVRFGSGGGLNAFCYDMKFGRHSVFNGDCERRDAFRPARKRACRFFCFCGVVHHVFSVANLFKIACRKQIEWVVIGFEKLVGSEFDNGVFVCVLDNGDIAVVFAEHRFKIHLASFGVGFDLRDLFVAEHGFDIVSEIVIVVVRVVEVAAFNFQSALKGCKNVFFHMRNEIYDDLGVNFESKAQRTVCGCMGFRTVDGVAFEDITLFGGCGDLHRGIGRENRADGGYDERTFFVVCGYRESDVGGLNDLNADFRVAFDGEVVFSVLTARKSGAV